MLRSSSLHLTRRFAAVTNFGAAIGASSSCSSFLSSAAATTNHVVSSASSLQLFAARFSSELATSNPNLAPQTMSAAGGDSPSSGASAESLTAAATEIAKRVNATKRAHQTATGEERKRLEAAAWQDLNTLTEDQIANADGQATAILLNAWAYFARYWARGAQGPL
jgi:hypothetical protein